MQKLSFIFSVFFLLIIQSSSGQDCAQDAKANEAKSKLEQGKGHGCSYAAQFYAYLCECENKPRTAEQARMLKATLERIKRGFENSDGCEGMGALPPVPSCKVGPKNGSSSSGEKSRQEKQLTEFRQSLYNARQIGGRLDAARDRAKRVSEELQQLTRINGDASPQQIMQQYNLNMQRMNQLEQELKRDIATSNFNTGADIINDYNTGNHEGAVYGTLGLLGQIFENQQAKKEIAAKKSQLQKQKENRMLSAALQMIQELREQSDMYIGYAANSLGKEREEYYRQLAEYYKDYANGVSQGFSYSHTLWATNSKQPPQQPFLPAEKSNPTASDFARAAERKFALFEKSGEQEYAKGAVRYMNAAINKNSRSSNYFLKLSKYYEEVNRGAALDAYLAAIELKPALKDEERYRKLSHEFVKEIHLNYWRFIPEFGQKKWRNYISKEQFEQNYAEPKQYLQNLLNDASISEPLILYTDFYGGMVFNSPLEVLLYSSAKSNKTHWEHVGMPPKFPHDNIRKMTQILQWCARDNNGNISTLLELGADPEMKIDGKDAIEIAIENGRREIYSQMINLSSNPEKYIDQYKQNGFQVVDQYINSSYDSGHIKSIKSFKQEETVALWMLDNFKTLYTINNGYSLDELSDYDNKIYEARDQGKSPQLKAKGADFGLLDVVKKRSSPLVNRRYEEVILAEPLCPQNFEQVDNSLYNRMDFEYGSWIKEGGLPMDDFFYPLDEYAKNLSPREEDLAAKFDSIGCVLCLDKKPFDEVVQKIMSFQDGYSLNETKENYAEYKKTGRYDGSYIKNTLTVLDKYNYLAQENGFPKMEFLQGRVLRPIDQANETYAHLALLYNRYYSFKAMNEIIPLATISNRRGKTVLDYLQVMIVENPQEYYKYALLPGIKDLIDWQKPFKGKTIFDVLVEDKAYEVIADLGAQGIIDKDLTPYAFEMAKLGKFKEIAKISQLGNLDITTKNSEGDGGNLLHALVKHIIFVDQSYYSDYEWKLKTSSAEIPTVESIREKYALDTFLILDKNLKRNDGSTPYKVFKSYAKQLLKANYDKGEYKKWKALLK